MKLSDAAKRELDEASLQAIVANRYAIAANYARTLKDTVGEEVERMRSNARLPQIDFDPVRQMKIWLKQDAKYTPVQDQQRLASVLAESTLLEQIYQMRQELTCLWERSTLTRPELVRLLQDWCNRAEQSGIAALQDFSFRLRTVV